MSSIVDILSIVIDIPSKIKSWDASAIMCQEYTTLILDLGGVLANFTTKNNVGLRSSLIKAALDSSYWNDYESGRATEAECYENICQEFNIDIETWTRALEQMRKEGLQANTSLISSIKELRQMYTKTKVFCLSNIPASESDALRDEIQSWGIIDEFIASGVICQRKPDTAAYEECLKIVDTPVSSCIFVDDKAENVVAAQTLGFKGIVFSDTDTLVRDLHNLLVDPVARAKAFLEHKVKTAGNMLLDNYSQLIMLQNTGIRDLIMPESDVHPEGSDTTSLAIAVLDNVPMDTKLKARDEILSNLNSDRLPLCWLSNSRPQFCHCMCASIFRFFVINDWGKDLPRVNDFLCRLLETRAYPHGSRYYKNPDWLLYILSDICESRPWDSQLQRMRDLLVECVRERMGFDDDFFGAVLRLLSAQSLGFQSERDLKIVLDGQQLDGGWELAWPWGHGVESLQVGSRGVLTAMAMTAIERANILAHEWNSRLFLSRAKLRGE
ncbi:unnamed protein product [Fusarium graminearum]|uniref:Uncharacterized protein n=1 Tax=Gibberella zeae TaxID=5518 RepID=A0A4E9DR99_GIBZA|nr:unnamed protein product [Fusarium graminearum]CAG1980556.1 unnamed protein product [Fusarium graminearum]